MKKSFTVFALVVACILLQSCGGSQELSYQVEKGNRLSYRFELQARPLHFTQEIDFVVLAAEQHMITLEARIRKGEFKNDSIMNADYARFVETTSCFNIDKHGNILSWCANSSKLANAAGAFNARFFFPCYSHEKTKAGSHWKNEDKIQDMIFDTMAEIYKVKSVSGDHVELEADYEMYATGGHAGKGYTGTCLVDVKTGMLISSKLNVSISSGGGTITIEKIKE